MITNSCLTFAFVDMPWLDSDISYINFGVYVRYNHINIIKPSCLKI